MPVSRRSFLATVSTVLASYAALSLTRRGNEAASGPLGANRAASPTQPQALSTPPPFQPIRSGIVNSIEGSDLLVSDSTFGDFRLRLAPDTVYDEGLWTGSIPIQPGDRILAKLHVADGRVVAESIWTNLEKLEGPVLALNGGPVAPFSLRMHDGYDDRRPSPFRESGHVVVIDPRTSVALPRPNQPVAYREPALDRPIPVRSGDHPLIVGRQMPDGTVLAASLMLS